VSIKKQRAASEQRDKTKTQTLKLKTITITITKMQNAGLSTLLHAAESAE
jgi:hypothetical protein